MVARYDYSQTKNTERQQDAPRKPDLPSSPNVVNDLDNDRVVHQPKIPETVKVRNGSKADAE